MQATIDISPDRTTQHEGAVITLCCGGTPTSELYFDFSSMLKVVRQPSETSLDLLLVAATVYSLDRLVSRKQSRDGWQRSFEVAVPVTNASRWSAASDTIEECVRFLSGDDWRMRFFERTCSIIRRRRRKRRPRVAPRFVQGAVTSLFSGGLDSLVGAIDWLEEADDQKISLVGHHDPQIGGVQKDQQELLKVLNQAYPHRCEPVLVGVGHSEKAFETTMRSRSLLFVALGIVVAAHLGDGTPLLIPENGTIAVNVPLTPARRGSCSTRTAHPHYLKLLQEWLERVELRHPLDNPLLQKTKGEVVSRCRSQSVLKEAALLSTSCAKRGHKSTWMRRTANACGRCMPCVYRRAALHTVGLDTEVYGNDICTGEVDVSDPNSEAADDLRACLSFLRSNHSTADIAKMLVANGPLPPLEALSHADTVQRAMVEVRRLLRDKATVAIQRMAGIGGGGGTC